MERIRSDRIIVGNDIISGFIYIDGGKIVEVSEHQHSVSEEHDLRGCFVSAGFIDIHTHGGAGRSFDGSVDDVVDACNFHLLHGTTSICPTISAAPFADMARSAESIAKAMTDPRINGTVIGAHLEGPYLSRSQAGAQCQDFIEAPKREDYAPLLKKHGKAIARWTYAPENDKDGSFLKALSEAGVVASVGHTDAVYDDMKKAAENGCRLVTHLYSCTSTVTRDHGFRRLGVIESAYLLDDLFVEIIADGKHLPPELIKLIYKIKGADKTALVTDSLSLAGTSKTHGFLQATEFVIEDGVCKLMGRSAFAGSVATADRLVRVTVKEAGVPLTDAVKMITETPATIMGLKSKGKIAQGYDADLAIFDSDINIKAVFARGKRVDLNSLGTRLLSQL